MAETVVSEVMIMGRRRLRPASWMASSKGTPDLRSSLMASSFRMESLMTIPQVTISPMADIRFSVCPQTQSSRSANATSIGISARTSKGCRKLSNCAARMKYISNRETRRITTSSSSISRFEKKLPEKPVSHSPVCPATRFTSFISFSASRTP